MIYDKLDNIELYKGISDDIYAGLEYLRVIDADIASGTYQINPRVKAIVSEYTTKHENEYGYETEAQCDLPVYYKGRLLEKRFRLDIVVEKDVIIELKAVEAILPEHRAQLYNYLRLTKKPVGILLNFGKSVRAEKYIYDPETNEVTFFNVKSTRQFNYLDEDL